MLPRLSVVTPSYNQADYLEQCMSSVLDQAYPNLEYMVVDGGSKDGSVDIIQKYSHQLSWWVSEADRGQAEAINKGLKHSSGEVVAWLNSDDFYMAGALEQAVSVLMANPHLGLVFGNLLAVDVSGQPINLMRFGEWGLQDLMRFEIIGQPAVFMRRSVLMKSGLLDENFHYMLDHHLWLRMAQHAGMKHVDSTWAAARFHAGAKNVSQSVGFSQEALRVFQWMQGQPLLADRFKSDRRRITAGAQRISGYYLSESGRRRDALKAYWKCFVQYPPTAIKDWKRIVYTLMPSSGKKSLRSLYQNWQQPRKRSLG
jgi:GT2 family glycosyltransferase